MISQAKAVRENGFETDYSTRQDENGSRDFTFHVETMEGQKLKVVPSKKGLHVLNCKSYFGHGKDGCVFGKLIVSSISVPTTKGVSLVSKGVEVIATIAGSKSNYTNRDVKRAKVTRCFQHVAGHLSDHTLICTTTTNGIKNLLIVIQDVKLMNAILGKS